MLGKQQSEKLSMVRMIKLYTLGSAEIREVTLQEGEKILKDTYNDPTGGLVADAKTGEVISQISSTVEEIIIIHRMVAGG